MKEAEKIKLEITQKFNLNSDLIIIQNPKRIWLEVDEAIFSDIFDYLVKQHKFSILCTITGLDEITSFGFIYHLANENGLVINLKFKQAKDQPIKTIIAYFPGAEIYEREIFDLLGVKVSGLPEGKRYPLPDDWPTGQYPLRKDWKEETLEKEQKNA